MTCALDKKQINNDYIRKHNFKGQYNSGKKKLEKLEKKAFKIMLRHLCVQNFNFLSFIMYRLYSKYCPKKLKKI